MSASQNCFTESRQETERDSVARLLSKVIVNFANNNVMEQYDTSFNIVGMEVTKQEDYVNRKRVFLFRHNTTNLHEKKYHRPNYLRTRKVVVSESQIDGANHLCIKCSCGLFFQRLCSCPHVYSLLDRPPIPDDLN